MDFLNKLFGKKQGTTASSSNVQPQNASMQIPDPSIEELRKQLKDSNLESRARAAEKLGQIGDLRSIPWLVEAIRDEYIQRNELAEEYQAEINRTGGHTPLGGSDAIRRRSDAIKSADVATKAKSALLRFGTSAVEPIVASLIATGGSKDWHVRSMLDHDLDWQVRRALGEILGEVLRRIDNLRSADPLIAALNDKDKDVRYTVAVTLGNLGNLRAVDPLTTALKDEDGDVRIATERALKELSKPATSSITLWAKDERTAQQLRSDQYFLLGVLMADSSDASKAFRDGLDKGGSLSYEVSRNSAKGGYDVKITLSP
jgi:HEAT repeat protein